MKLQNLTETFELPGVVPYPEEGRLATDHRRPSTFLTAPWLKANWLGDTLGESRGDRLAPPPPGEWHLGRVGEVVTIIDFRWARVDGRRCWTTPGIDPGPAGPPALTESSFCKIVGKGGISKTSAF